MNEVIAMKGGGYYSLATLGAKHVIDGATPLVLDAIAAMPDSRGPFVFADMGTADGGTSRDLVERMVEAVRRRSPGREIALVYTDQPRNVGRERPCRDLGRRADLRDATAFEDDDALSQQQRLDRIVRDDRDRPVELAQVLAQFTLHLGAGLHVECGERLVE